MNLKIRDKVEEKIRGYIERHSLQSLEFPKEILPTALFSPFILELPDSVLKQAQSLAKDLYELKNDTLYTQAAYKRHSLGDINESSLIGDSFSSCLDLHLDTKENAPKIKLIEFNTNAALMGLSYFIHEALGVIHPLGSSVDQIKKDLLELIGSARLIKQKVRPNHFFATDDNPRIAIIDSEPQKQNLYGDFLFHQTLLRSWGWSCEIFDTAFFSEEILREDAFARFDLVINRDTDFYFENPRHQNLLKLWRQGLIVLSPHPGDYCLFADKLRMLDWQERLKDNSPILKTQILTTENKDALWSNRKKYIFKPTSSFGSKQVYKGSSISRKLFDELFKSSSSFLAQEFCEPLRFSLSESDLKKLKSLGYEITSPAESQAPLELKVDLRFYLFKDQIRSTLARIYQGQVTNLQSPLSGFVPIQFKAQAHMKLEVLDLGF